MKIRPQKNTTYKKIFMVLLVVLLTGVVGYVAYASQTNLWPFSETPTHDTVSIAPEEVTDINYNEPTDEEIEAGQHAKKQYLNENDGSESVVSDKNKQSAPVGIAYADVHNDILEIRAFTNSVVQSGQCRAIIAQSGTGTVVKRSSTAFIDTSTTQCEPMYISTELLSSGKWDVVVEFSSATHHGKSQPREVSIP